MAKYLITKTERYLVSADDPRLALDHFHLYFNNLELSDFAWQKISLNQDDFSYLGGADTIEEAPIVWTCPECEKSFSDPDDFVYGHDCEV